MPKQLALKMVVATVALSFSQLAAAAVVVGPTSGGYSTFTDTLTNRQWVKLDTFFNRSSTSMFTELTAAGFTVGTRTDVQQLLDTLQPIGANWASYASIMGRAPNRDLIWGAYQVSDQNRIGWAFSFNGASTWSYNDNAAFASDIPNGGSADADMNVWAFRTDAQGAVPEPAAWMMMLIGMAGIGFSMRRKDKQTLRVRFA